ncbi:MAG TPA: hypothetical protein VEH29_15185 [Acidimicrobiales bacterium]|nr:hypothetical protein [Acidimicrobiales bacterium]
MAVFAVLDAALRAHPKAPPPPPLFLLPNFTSVLELFLFLAVLWFLANSVLPKLRQAMTEREGRQREQLQAAEVARSSALEADLERRRVLQGARAEARSIVDTARTEAELIVAEHRQRAQHKREALLVEGRMVVASEKQRAMELLRERTDELGELAAARVLGVEPGGRGPADH